MRSFLVVANDQSAYEAIQDCFEPGLIIDYAGSLETALDILRKRRYDIVFIDIDLLSQPDNEYGLHSALHQFWQLYPAMQLIVMTSPYRIRGAVMAIKEGASDYVMYPLNRDELRLVAETVYESTRTQSEIEYLRDQFWQPDSLQVIKTDNALMQKIFGRVRSVAPTKSTVLFIGETGTGKGVLAKLTHRHSNRKDGPFISVHCGAIPETLLESELFGHEKGSFTGAFRRKLGKFEIAKGGTIFLDEIGTISPSAQIKLLQVLQDGTFSRVGGEDIIEADVRIIAATNADLKKMCEEGRFRNDLYYRLNVFPLEIPPLRERSEDLPLLITSILGKLNRKFSREIKGVHPQVLEAFRRYEWPGNIRELENLLERACILETSTTLTVESFPSEIFAATEFHLTNVTVDTSLALAVARNQALEDFERRYLRALLAQHKGKINESAESAGVSTRQLHKLMTKYGLKKEEYKHALIAS